MTVTRHRAGTKAPDSAAAVEAGYSLTEKGAEGEGASREQPGPVKHALSPGAGESRPVPAMSQCPGEEAARWGRPAGRRQHSLPAARQSSSGLWRPTAPRPPRRAPTRLPARNRGAACPERLAKGDCPSLEGRQQREPRSRRLLTTFPTTSPLPQQPPPPLPSAPRCCSQLCSPQPSSARGPPAAPGASSPPGSSSLRTPLSRTPAARRGRQGSQRALWRTRNTPIASGCDCCGDSCPLPSSVPPRHCRLLPTARRSRASALPPARRSGPASAHNMAPRPYLSVLLRLREPSPGGSSAAPALTACRCWVRVGVSCATGDGSSQVHSARREVAAARGGAEPRLAAGERLERGAGGDPRGTGSVPGAAVPPPLPAGPELPVARHGCTSPLRYLDRFCQGLCKAAAGRPAGLEGGSGRAAVLYTKRRCEVSPSAPPLRGSVRPAPTERAVNGRPQLPLLGRMGEIKSFLT